MEQTACIDTCGTISYNDRMNSIFSYTPDALPKLVASLKQPKFRTKQLTQWLYQHAAQSYDDMTNLPKAMREELARVAPLEVPTIIDKQISTDGTQKFLLQLSDGALVETVAIPSRDRNVQGDARRLTVCFSTQVGCSMGCAFCATGREGFTRNLLPGEMVWQLIICQQELGIRVSNAVGMGQGEPFLNYDNVIGALRFINSADGMAIGARHLSVSTCGIPQAIERFGREPEQFTLAVSLHSADQPTRDALMPHCANAPLAFLHQSIEKYQAACHRRVSFEYLMIQDLNDSPEDLEMLVEYCRGLSVHINLLHVNSVEGSPFTPSPEKRLKKFVATLEKNNISATIRDSRGADIDGACGQLKNKRLAH
ncbi:MAG: 23S rRNA (adenine(2503)-C(2))-methyltransferase RlmN [Eggerthellaceae bacterium]|jgi:23S rRNA (adenine2503-C2)-methyltransferase